MNFFDIIRKTAVSVAQQRQANVNGAPQAGGIRTSAVAECTPCAANSYIQDQMRNIEVQNGRRKPPRKKR